MKVKMEDGNIQVNRRMIQNILPIVGDLAGSWLKGKAEESRCPKTKLQRLKPKQRL